MTLVVTNYQTYGTQLKTTLFNSYVDSTIVTQYVWGRIDVHGGKSMTLSIE
jgi:hypothetical protein